ncbi:amino acid permease [Candidatus Accumulibacter phosphatis]|uniref:amino acid permease n=1 Tax=Candidatus Accumulibacter phosphatis TaxID=327160 RepID=UPI00248291B3|nr:amino acid permease [Candidatus Accumulibacter phosphatis]
MLLTFGGWNEAAYLSSELHGGPRAVAHVLILSLSVITTLYLLANLALLHGLGLSGLAASKAAGAEVLGLHFGAWGERLLGVLVALAALTSIHSTMIVGARSNYALGRDWALLRRLGRWQAGRGAPVNAYVLQTVSASRWSSLARSRPMASRQWWSSRRRSSGPSCSWSGSPSSGCACATPTFRGRSVCRSTR